MLTQQQWQNGRRGQDGWGKYTRRRKWYRDAELVEVTPSTDITPCATPKGRAAQSSDRIDNIAELSSEPPAPRYSNDISDTMSVGSTSSGKSSLFKRRGSERSKLSGMRMNKSTVNDEEDEMLGSRDTKNSDWGIGDDARMGLE